MEKSNVGRHLIGGFVGGMLGIFAFYLINKAMLPVGCFVGCVLGFWWDRITVVLRGGLQILRGQTSEPQVAAHPAKKAVSDEFLGRCLAVVVFWASVAFATYYIHRNNPTPTDIGFIALFLTPVITGFVIAWRYRETGYSAHTNDKGDNPDDRYINAARREELRVLRQRDFYRLYALRSVWGPWLFAREFAITLFLLFAFPVLLACFMATALAGILVASMPVLLVAAIGFVLHGIYQIAVGRGHWLCVGTTIVVTALTAYLLGDQVQGTALWIAAFIAGCASGLVSVGAHWLLRTSLDASPRVKDFLKDPGGHTATGLNWLWMWLFPNHKYQYGYVYARRAV